MQPDSLRYAAAQSNSLPALSCVRSAASCVLQGWYVRAVCLGMSMHRNSGHLQSGHTSCLQVCLVFLRELVFWHLLKDRLLGASLRAHGGVPCVEVSDQGRQAEL